MIALVDSGLTFSFSNCQQDFAITIDFHPENVGRRRVGLPMPGNTLPTNSQSPHPRAMVGWGRVSVALVQVDMPDSAKDCSRGCTHTQRDDENARDHVATML
jgi:hypothetical protein